MGILTMYNMSEIKNLLYAMFVFEMFLVWAITLWSLDWYNKLNIIQLHTLQWLNITAVDCM